MRGIIIILLIAGAFASAGFLLGQSILGWFIIGVIAQLLFNFTLNRIMMIWGQNNINRLEVERLNAISKNLVQLKCANCQNIQEEEVLFAAKSNQYDCKKCNRQNTVYISIETAQKTILPDNDILTDDIIKKMDTKLKEEDGFNQQH